MTSSFANLRAAALRQNTLSTDVFGKAVTYKKSGAGATFSLTASVKYDARLKVDDATGQEAYVEQAKVKFAKADLVSGGYNFLPGAGDAIWIYGDADHPYLFAYIAERRELWVRAVYERLAIRAQGVRGR